MNNRSTAAGIAGNYPGITWTEWWEDHKDDCKYIYDRAVDAINTCENLLSTDRSHYAEQAYESTYDKMLTALLMSLPDTFKASMGISGMVLHKKEFFCRK